MNNNQQTTHHLQSGKATSIHEISSLLYAYSMKQGLPSLMKNICYNRRDILSRKLKEDATRSSLEKQGQASFTNGRIFPSRLPFSDVQSLLFSICSAPTYCLHSLPSMPIPSGHTLASAGSNSQGPRKCLNAKALSLFTRIRT